MNSTDLELLLQASTDNSSGVMSDTEAASLSEERKKAPPPFKANKSANLQDFIKMVSKIVSMALKKQKVEFIPDEGKRVLVDPNEKIDHPFITYKVISRTPKGELKPRERESLIAEDVAKDADGRQGRVYGQKFKCYVQFNIIASEYSEADEVMNTFEDLILSYAHYFKKNGVAELLFEKHLTDENFDIYRQTMSVRNLQYYVEVERLTVVFDSEIKDIQIND
ncbi:hypothetical protein [Heyndrickxia sporothermodurans]|uniref:hypothetical protein n=1 Tax=Heyndrickxia sporothermodurans TaxID=46224 RepID=UPI000D3A32A9|nr:hypothetical protein [Heyndrickxia sporothermodurans]PTY92887.1 hypothetical protein B5V90_02075 [Heyndrickxia sporothermodurans]